MQTVLTEETPSERWPVTARELLTKREQRLYRLLLAAYPTYRIFPQVALSQLIDVPQSVPNRLAIRNQFSQLVADFVVYRADLTFVAAVELDDRTHRRPDRQRADARKSQALRDAGLKLVRIPAGPLPSIEMIRHAIECEAGHPKPVAVPERRLESSDLDDIQGAVLAEPPDVTRLYMEAAALRPVVAKPVLALAVLILGGFAYVHALSWMGARTIISNAAVSEQATARAAPSVVAGGPPSRAVPMPTAEAGALPPIDAAGKLHQKDEAWAAYYKASPSCLHPVDWNAEVECGNLYIRARRDFESQWARATGTHSPGEIVLDNDLLKNSP
ncbi:MAG TPA: DUF2726 domain-containing protein [Steroidobacteraceae bacterium]|jgi:hypothetical protein|nr:DUF2726 domain-containing protein [Steroidobacteraceae bacterium]